MVDHTSTASTTRPWPCPFAQIGRSIIFSESNTSFFSSSSYIYKRYLNLTIVWLENWRIDHSRCLISNLPPSSTRIPLSPNFTLQLCLHIIPIRIQPTVTVEATANVSNWWVLNSCSATHIWPQLRVALWDESCINRAVGQDASGFLRPGCTIQASCAGQRSLWLPVLSHSPFSRYLYRLRSITDANAFPDLPCDLCVNPAF